MSIEEFLNHMAQDKSNLQKYQKTRGQFADACVREILEVYNECYPYADIASWDSLNSLVAKYQLLSANVYQMLELFMQHYHKVDSFTFQIVPEGSWNKEVELDDIAADIASFLEKRKSDSVHFEDDVKYYAKLRRDTRCAYQRTHGVLKKKAFDFFPAIIDLPSLGLRELDFVLFQETKNYLEVFSEIVFDTV